MNKAVPENIINTEADPKEAVKTEQFQLFRNARPLKKISAKGRTHESRIEEVMRKAMTIARADGNEFYEIRLPSGKLVPVIVPTR